MNGINVGTSKVSTGYKEVKILIILYQVRLQ